jgi:hypothetical protein
MRRLSIATCAVVVLAGLPPLAWAAGYGLGSTVDKVTLADQFGTRHVIDERVNVIVLTRDMAAGDIVKAALGHDGKTLLDQYRAVYVSDVSAIPTLVREYLAVPKLKERTYPMLLDTNGDFSARLPSRDKSATLLFLQGLRIVAVEYVATPATFVPTLKAPKRFATR